MISPQTPIRDVLAAHPETRPVFARHGLDTCCGGAHPVAMAAGAHKLDLQTLMAELESAVATKPVKPETTVRDVMARWPWTVRIFERHGLTGCGGSQGPDEPLGFFATAHEVDPEGLLHEINEAVAVGPPPEAKAIAISGPQVDLYPPFIKGAILATLTGGATLGLVALTIAGFRGSLNTGLSWWTPVIQAHGHVQIFGWVALFIMGVAYHVVPRFKATDLHSPDLARRSFWLMSGGLIARSLAQPYVQETFASLVGVAGALAELLAVALFARIIARTIASSAARAGFERYLLAGNAWFLALAAANLGTMVGMALTGDPVIAPRLDNAFIHVEVVGFVGLWILGVSLRILPVFLGLRPLGASATRRVLWAVNVAVALAAFAEISGAAVLRVPAALLEWAAVMAFVLGTRVFRRPAPSPHADPNPYYRKFIVAAYGWLAFATALLAFLSVFEVTVAPLPRELTGSYRHAITVGFITAMIMGVASRVVPVFRGVALQGVGSINVAFWLLNVGCAIRVVFQGIAGFLGAPFTLVSASSAYLEVSAIAIFGVVIWKTLDAQVAMEPATDQITLDNRVGPLIEKRPELLAVFLRHGFAPLANPVLRRTMGAVVTVRQACGLHNVDADAVLRDLRAAATPPSGRRGMPLRVVS